MTDNEEDKLQNTAEAWSQVGIQAGQVHNSTVYMGSSDSPEEKYKVGVCYLADGVPGRARDLIKEAMMRGHDNSEACFHWVLAMLSKRAYRDLNAGEREQLGQIPDFLCRYSEDAWKRALVAIHELLECLHGSGGDPGVALDAIHNLPPHQRDLIVRHLDLVLTGGAKDKLWAETRDAARAAQRSGDRANRVWAYFEPTPIEARTREPAAVATTLSDWLWAVTATVPFIVSVWYLGWAVLASGMSMPVVAYATALCAGCVAFLSGLVWHYREHQLHARERAHSGRRGSEPSREGGFAARVHWAFRYYFVKYAPEKMDLEKWLTATADIRAALRDEIVDLYREDRISIGRVRWLIRYLVRDVKDRWMADTLRDYRKKWRVRTVTKLCFLLSLALLLPAVADVAVVAANADPVRGTVTVVLLLISGRATVVRWSRIILERRRFADDLQEYKQVHADREAEYERWRRKIKSSKPDESDMERWLTCDKTMLLAEALRYYKLAWRDVIVHAFLQTPAGFYKKARMHRCPWRYSRYDMRLFLITQDGVREYRSEFDFERVETRRTERNNFRFDAVSSVGVVKTKDLSYTLELTLTNGPAKNILVTDVAAHEPDADEKAPDVEENPERFSEINLDAAGFLPTLHILEGIAAEGKGWLQRDADGGGRPPVPDEVREFEPVSELVPVADLTDRGVLRRGATA